MKTHIQVVAVLNMVIGGFLLLVGLLVFGFFALLGTAMVATGDKGVTGDIAPFGIVMLLIFIFWIILSLPNVIAGWGLYTGKPWAKPLTLVLAVFEFFGFPIGTVLAIYTFWALLSPEPQTRMPSQHHY